MVDDDPMIKAQTTIQSLFDTLMASIMRAEDARILMGIPELDASKITTGTFGTSVIRPESFLLYDAELQVQAPTWFTPPSMDVSWTTKVVVLQPNSSVEL